MKINIFILLSGIFVLTAQAQAAALYQANFQNGSALSSYGLGVNFGSPEIKHVFGATSDNQLVFNSPFGGYEQVQLNWPSAMHGGSYQISFDLMTQNLVDSPYAFTMFLDTPIVQNLYFGGYGNDIYTYNPIASGPPAVGIVGKLSDNSLMHVEINVNLNQSLWKVTIDGVGQSQIPFYTSSGGIEHLRFSLAPWNSDAGPAPNASVALDNLTISSVPLPAAGGLLLSALSALAFTARRRLSR